MKPSLALFRVPRRLAQDVLKSAESVEKAGNVSANPYFAELPVVLQNFFKKYPPAPFRTYSDKPTATNAPDANPFLANKHPITQNWHKPRYSMRRQADLWKAAYRFGIEHLLPNLLHNKTFYEQRYATAKPVRGQLFFKLSKGERAAPSREVEVKEATAKADSKILEKKGKRFEKFLERKRNLGLV